MNDPLEHIIQMLEAQSTELSYLRGCVDRLMENRMLDVLSSKEVCEILGISRTKMHEMIQQGELKMWKLDGKRKIMRSELEAFIRRAAGLDGEVDDARG